MFWSIFFNSLALIAAILVVGFVIDYMINNRSR